MWVILIIIIGKIEDLLLCMESHIFIFSFCELPIISFVYFSTGMLAFLFFFILFYFFRK